MNFQDQSQVFLTNCTTRNRSPIKPSTLLTYRGRLEKHVLPTIGTRDIETFGNGALKEFAQGLSAKTLSPKTVLEIVALVQSVVASAVTPDGDRMFPRSWNYDFLDLPPVVSQKQPTVTPEQLNRALKDERYSLFYAFLAGTGMRVGEALACKCGQDGVSTGWNPDRALVDVKTRLYRGQEGPPKTRAGIREIDLDPQLNTRLRTYASLKGVKMGAPLFQSAAGTPLQETTVRERSLSPLCIEGFHAFRRFRVSRLREQAAPEDLIRYWIGHENGNMTDRYSKLSQNEELRRTWASKVGLGFKL
ncbi:MAG: tyrosine-type recombinase/integrase [Terracidiphilus sp.]